MKALRRRLQKAQSLADLASPPRDKVTPADVAWVTSLGCDAHIEDPAEIGSLDSESWIVRFTTPELERIEDAWAQESGEP